MKEERQKLTEEKVSIGRVILFALIVLVLLVLSMLSVLASYFTVALIIVYSINSIVNIIKHRQVKHKVLAIVLVSIPNILLVCTLFWRLDAPPISDDYTIADLRSGGAEASESYKILLSLADKTEESPDALGIGLTKNEVRVIYDIYTIFADEADNPDGVNIKKISGDTGVVRDIWRKAETGRDIINKLSGFKEIADLTQPDMFPSLGFLRDIKNMSHLYNLHAWLQCEQGEPDVAVRDIIEFDSVVRKLSVNARSLVVKVLCYSCLQQNIRTANFIVNNPRTSQETVELLAEHFVPFSNEELSLRNVFVFEYIMSTKGLQENVIEEIPSLRFIRNVPFIKWNSTFRVCRNYWDELLATTGESAGLSNRPLSVWPEIYPDLGPVAMDSNGEFPWYYRSYNPVGTKLLVIMTPALGKIIKMKTELKLQDDLLQIMLDKRLGMTMGKVGK